MKRVRPHNFSKGYGDRRFQVADFRFQWSMARRWNEGLRIEGIIWLEDIVEKLILKHGVDQDEVIQVLRNKPVFRLIEKGHRKDENLYAALGQTDPGRYLTVFFVYKKTKQALIISARGMTRSERRRYAEK